MVPADSRKISHVPRYSGYHHFVLPRCTGLSPSMVELSRTIPPTIYSDYVVLQPHACLNIHGLGYSPFARHYLGNHYCFLFLRLLRCFSSPGELPDKSGFLIFNQEGYPIRKSTPQRLFASQHSLSQLITSFIAVMSQGIRHARV